MWTALVLAGSRPGRDAFAESHGTDLKALIPVGGVPMVARPVTALLAAPAIATVRVLAQQPARIAAVLPTEPRLQRRTFRRHHCRNNRVDPRRSRHHLPAAGHHRRPRLAR